ncbi:MAG: DEAD/DEAH box helicase [Methanospirillum sp.]|uniref:DEAD/DEAH box helicase n=1 Tax=Methanospirillum sp. TaxID=45200 RepID=UPI002372D6F0|nr:DEAD/DEAH box helicase [Methanospirillum sp.]MDD1727941.1 DEAD/DEAH box helicase [Methanospirillum sp.]
MPDSSIFFKLHPSLQQVIHHTLHWKELRRIQELAYEPICSGVDLLLTARTAGGKSEAAFIPVLDQILKNHPSLPFCLYISPLRALIADMSDRLDHLLTPFHLTTVQVHSDCPGSFIPDSDPPAILFTTPESLAILLHGSSGPLLVDRVTICIIDEVHSLAASERGIQLLASLDQMEQRSGHHIQRIGLSATIGNPEDVLVWMSGGRAGSQVVRAEHEPLSREFFFCCGWDNTDQKRVESLIRGRRSLIFSRSRGEAETLSSLLEGSEVPIYVHHSSVSPASRKEAEQAFARGTCGAIICTGTLELGIDIGSLDLVIHSGPVISVSSFLQRLGRVGRRGTHAQMAFLLNDPEETITVAAVISLAAAGEIEPVRIIRYPYRVLVQQIVLSLLTESRIPRQRLMNRLQGSGAFDNISNEQICSVIASLVEAGLILIDQNFLMPAPALEGWADLQHGSQYSVISEGRICTVKSPEGDLIGTVSMKGADLCRLNRFRLGGRSWISAGNDPDPTTIQANPVSFPAEPPVFGGSFQGTSYLLMQKVSEIVRDGLPDLPFPNQVHQLVHEYTSCLPEGSGPERIILRKESESVKVYTFLGAEWNRVIFHYLKHSCRKKKCVSLKGGFDGVSIHMTSGVLSSEWILDRIIALSQSDPSEPGEWIYTIREVNRSYDQFLSHESLRNMLIFDQIRLDKLVCELNSREIIIASEL